jgi:hypothetical protein
MWAAEGPSRRASTDHDGDDLSRIATDWALAWRSGALRQSPLRSA